MNDTENLYLVCKLHTEIHTTLFYQKVCLETKKLAGMMPVYKNLEEAKEASRNGKYPIITVKAVKPEEEEKK